MRFESAGRTAPLPRSLLSPLLASLLLLPLAVGQTPPHPAAQTANSPTLEKNVNEVSLDLVVRDKKDHTVRDLTPADIAVSDNGALVKINSLRLSSPEPGSPRLVMMVFDHFDSIVGKNARAIAGKIIKEIPNQDFLFAVFCVDGRLRLLQQFTADRGLIDRAVASATAAPGTDLGVESALAEKALTAQAASAASRGLAQGAGVTNISVTERDSARVMTAALANSQRLAADQRFLSRREASGLAAVTALAQAAARLPGRKVLLYFSGGIEADTRALDMVNSAAGAANRAGISIYAVDMSTLSLDPNQDMMATMAMGSNQAASHFNPTLSTTHIPAGVRTEITSNTANLEFTDPELGLSPLGRLTKDTGGSQIPAQMNVSKRVRQLVEDTDSFYTATYTPPIADYDGSFRAVAVKPLRKNIAIRTRSGYFALPPGDQSGMRPFELPLLKLLRQSTPPPSDFSFRSQVAQMGELPGGLTQELAVEAPIANLELREDGTSKLFSLHAAVLAQIVDAAGTVVEQFSEDMHQRGALDKIETVRSEVLSFQRPFVAAPGNYTVKVAVLDVNSGKASIQQNSLRIAPAGEGPSLSDLLVVRRTEADRKEQRPSGDSGNVDTLDPLRSASGEVVPNLSATAAHGARELSLYLLIHPGPPALGKPTLEMTVSRNGHPVGRSPLVLRETASGGPVPYFATLGTSAMHPGEYLATIRITQGARSFERSIPLTIEAAKANEATGAAGAKALPLETSPAELGPDASAELPPLAVTPAGPGAPVPSPEEISQMLEGARKRALDYATGLPNFLCAEMTNRSTDSSGVGHWKHQDSFSELISYRNHAETRRMIEVNGQRSHEERDDLKGAVSHGEFGGILSAVFDPSAHTDFQWKQTGLADGATAQVFEYRVAAKNSSFGLTGDNKWQINAAFHGVVSIDAATLGVRQITIVADELPAGFSIHSSAIEVQYDYIAINGHDYLLPTRATISLRRHKHEGVLNEIQFRDYRRFAAKSRMIPVS